jgi:hypothetical protein
MAIGPIWHPPSYGRECRLRSDTTGFHQYRAYHFDGIRLRTLDNTAFLSSTDHVELLRTTSVFHDCGRIWVTPSDVTKIGPHSDDDDPSFIFWNFLTFLWPPEKYDLATNQVVHHGHSTVTHHGCHHDQLYAQRDDQMWHKYLLPSGFHQDSEDRHKVPGAQPPFGSLNGNLSLLLALLGLTADSETDNVEATILRCVRGGSWQTPDEYHGYGCEYFVREKY